MSKIHKFDSFLNEAKKNKVRILSPDGFDIEMDKTYKPEEVDAAIEKFIARYKSQGYYSNSNRERIPIGEIKDLMQVVPLEESIEESLNEGNLENLKIVLSALKDASAEEIEKISEKIYNKLTWGNILDIAQIVGVEKEIKK